MGSDDESIGAVNGGGTTPLVDYFSTGCSLQLAVPCSWSHHFFSLVSWLAIRLAAWVAGSGWLAG